MMILVIGDIHINDNFIIFKKILFPFLKQIIAQYNIDKVVILGDIFDTSSLSNTNLALFKQLMTIFKDYEVEIIVGNHDKIDAKISVYDLLLYPENIKIIKSLSFNGNEIFIPHVDKKLNLSSDIESVRRYIDRSEEDYLLIYSHNDFNELYKFENKFISISEMLKDVDKPVYLINGHNHVPFFRDKGNFKILNIGNAINLNFRDTGVYNNFLLINTSENDEDKRISVIQNKYSIQYYTFIISKNEDIENSLSTLDSDNIKYVNFKITSPNIVIDTNYRDSLEDKYNIADIKIEYDIKVNEYTEDSIDNSSEIDTQDIEDIFKKLNISIDEFLEYNTVDDIEKLEILYFLLDSLFKDKIMTEDNQNEIIATVNKYFIMVKNDKK